MKDTVLKERPRFEIVENDRAHWEFVRQLRNNEQVKGGFINQEHISESAHRDYMMEHSDDYYLCKVDGELAGYVGVVDGDIRVATHPKFQRMGVAEFMIGFISELKPKAVAKVKVENEASLGLFAKAGYEIKYYLLEQRAKDAT